MEWLKITVRNENWERKEQRNEAMVVRVLVRTWVYMGLVSKN
jgi:hypothetical protein